MKTPAFMSLISVLVLVAVVGLSLFGGRGTEAHASFEVAKDGFTLLTAHSRDMRVSEETEVVYLLDHHRGMLLVYGLTEMSSQPTISLLDGGRIEVLFEQGRAIDRGRAGQ